eukprot:GHVU01063835.1.p1 GENE.GHVU01063835.1~~GHVU01063835.1.p1  ORF type:complete len:200 (+),score=18.38 GHVU01063835.1:180-779(+)
MRTRHLRPRHAELVGLFLLVHVIIFFLLLVAPYRAQGGCGDPAVSISGANCFFISAGPRSIAAERGWSPCIRVSLQRRLRIPSAATVIASPLRRRPRLSPPLWAERNWRDRGLVGSTGRKRGARGSRKRNPATPPHDPADPPTVDDDDSLVEPLFEPPDVSSGGHSRTELAQFQPVCNMMMQVVLVRVHVSMRQIMDSI